MKSNTNTPTRFRLSGGFDQAQIEAILAERYAFLVEAPLAQSWRIYDTFDRRLLAKSMTLRWSGEDLVLSPVADGDRYFQLPVATPPRFALDLPEGVFRQELATIIEVRALLELATVHTWSRSYRILNDDEKTVARLVYTEARAEINDEDSPRSTYLTVWPLRGYAKQAGRLARYLRRSLKVDPTKDDVHLWALQAAGQAPGAYTGKLDVHLHPNMPAGEATKLILRQLLEMMRANEAGIIADVDVEFLHDYRIAVRRTRSILNQIRNVLPKARTGHFQREFKALGQLTNDLRDLDVYLLAEANYRAALPEAMVEDIRPLFDSLRSHRAEALAKVVAGLESEAYTRLMAEWEAFLNEPAGADDAAKTLTPIIDVARERLMRQYRAIVRDGAYILKHTEDELLHELRIECKKLRYLLEFFASLFPPKEMSRVIKHMKGLQDNLGTFTDNTLQREYLLSAAETLDIDETLARRALVATGYLVETSDRKLQDAKDHFAGTFKEFASRAHQQEFKRVFSGGRKVRS